MAESHAMGIYGTISLGGVGEESDILITGVKDNGWAACIQTEIDRA